MIKKTEDFIISRQEISEDIVREPEDSSHEINFLQVLSQKNNIYTSNGIFIVHVHKLLKTSNLAKNQIKINQKNIIEEVDIIDSVKEEQTKNKLILANLNHKFDSHNTKVVKQKTL